MVLKKKSISVSSVLCIIFAALLVLSITLSLTGAWFTDTATGNNTVTFGQVKVGDSLTVTVPDNIVPTQKITISDTTYQGVAAYYRLTISVSNVSGGTASESELNTLLGASTKYGSIPASQIASTFTIDDIEISKSTGNKFQNVTCTLTVTLDVIQQEGTAATTPNTTAEWEAVFAQCTDYTNGTAAA